jgi:hypothetical protein
MKKNVSELLLKLKKNFQGLRSNILALILHPCQMPEKWQKLFRNAITGWMY